MRKRNFLLSFALLVSSLFAFSGCEWNIFNPDSGSDSSVEQQIQLVDFSDKTEELEFGSTYALNSVVSDTNNNDYQVSYTVVDSNNQIVALHGYDLVINDLNGYVITCSAIMPNGENSTRVITINVKDTTAPVVSIARVSN